MGSNIPGFYDGQHDSSSRVRNPNPAAAGPSSAPPAQTRFEEYGNQGPVADEKFPNPRDPHPSAHRPYRQQTNDSEGNENFAPAQHGQRMTSNPFPQGMGGEELTPQVSRKGVLQKNRRFVDGYAEEGQGGNKGSSGSSKKVMDFFRRMGKSRTETR